MFKINQELKKYIEENIFPLYNNNVGGHGIEHIQFVIDRSFQLIHEFDLNVNYNMVYVIAVFHDLGYPIDKENHEKVSAEMFFNNKTMKTFFTEEQIKIIKEAIIDHRASLEYTARSIYGKIISSADREISLDNTLKRSILFQIDKHIEKNPTILEIIEYSYKKLSKKYGKNGYAKMYFQDKLYKDYIKTINSLLENKEQFIEMELQIIKQIRLENKILIKSLK